MSRNPTAPRGIEKQETDEDERVLLDHIIAERKRTTFQGVDLSQIVLLLRHGLNLVTTVRNANTKGYAPPGIAEFGVKFSGNAHGHDTIPFHFNLDVFPTNMTVELIVKCILRIRGIDVDGTTDLSTLWTDRGYAESVKSVEREQRLFPKAAEMQYMAGGVTGYGSFGKNASEERVRYGQQLALRTNAYLKHQSEKRFDQLDREFHAYKEKQGKRKTVSVEDFWIDRIRQVKNDILFFDQGRLKMVTLASTLSNPSNALRIRFNKFDVYPTDTVGEKLELISLLVDPNICDSYLSPKLYIELFKVSKKHSKKRVVLIHRPTFYDELSDLESVIFGTDETRLEKLKSIQYIRMHNTKGNKAWNQPMFRVVEWATKSAPPTIFDPPDDFVLPPS